MLDYFEKHRNVIKRSVVLSFVFLTTFCAVTILVCAYSLMISNLSFSQIVHNQLFARVLANLIWLPFSVAFVAWTNGL